MKWLCDSGYFSNEDFKKHPANHGAAFGVPHPVSEN